MTCQIQQRCMQKRPNYEQRSNKVDQCGEVAESQPSELAQPYLKTFNWVQRAHQAYLLDVSPSAYHLFSSGAHALAAAQLDFHKNVRKYNDDKRASNTVF